MDEKQTREQLIDKQLKTAGWIPKYVKEEDSEATNAGAVYIVDGNNL